MPFRWKILIQNIATFLIKSPIKWIKKILAQNRVEKRRKMETPKSPKTPSKEEASFWDKLGTLGRKKKIKEGKQSVNSVKLEFIPKMEISNKIQGHQKNLF